MIQVTCGIFQQTIANLKECYFSLFNHEIAIYWIRLTSHHQPGAADPSVSEGVTICVFPTLLSKSIRCSRALRNARSEPRMQIKLYTYRQFVDQ
jgi:hypothetical protein